MVFLGKKVHTLLRRKLIALRLKLLSRVEGLKARRLESQEARKWERWFLGSWCLRPVFAEAFTFVCCHPRLPAFQRSSPFSVSRLASQLPSVPAFLL
jgi:hypothetical protein